MEKQENYLNTTTLEKPKVPSYMGVIFGNEIGCVDQGIKGQTKVIHTMAFIKKGEVP